MPDPDRDDVEATKLANMLRFRRARKLQLEPKTRGVRLAVTDVDALIAVLDRLAARVAALDDRLVVFDCDCTIADWKGVIRPGIPLLFAVLERLGFQIVIWSGAGAEHAREVVEAGGLAAGKTFYTKPDYPIHEDAALALLGQRPVLVLDDDPGEDSTSFPFLLVERFTDAEVPQ